MTDPIEVMARALCEFDCSNWDEQQEDWRESDREIARIALRALEAAGYRLAEREPTKEMLSKASVEGIVGVTLRNGWRDMWDALPRWGKK